MKNKKKTFQLTSQEEVLVMSVNFNILHNKVDDTYSKVESAIQLTLKEVIESYQKQAETRHIKLNSNQMSHFINKDFVFVKSTN